MCTVVHICILIYANYYFKACPWNEGVHSMQGTRRHERTGNAVESLAKSTTSGSSSNMLFSIMFLGRLARSTTHRRRGNQTQASKKGEMREVSERQQNHNGYTHWHTHTHTVLYVKICAVFLEFQRFPLKSNGNKPFFNTKACYCHLMCRQHEALFNKALTELL